MGSEIQEFLAILTGVRIDAQGLLDTGRYGTGQ